MATACPDPDKLKEKLTGKISICIYLYIVALMFQLILTIKNSQEKKTVFINC